MGCTSYSDGASCAYVDPDRGANAAYIPEVQRNIANTQAPADFVLSDQRDELGNQQDLLVECSSASFEVQNDS